MQFLKWVGTITSILGSFAVALHFFLVGYVLFLVGSTAWLYAGVLTKDKPLLILNLFFLIANLLGLYNAI